LLLLLTAACCLLLLLLLLLLAALVAWRSRRATTIRLSAPFIFLALALVVTLALNINYGLRERFVAVLPGQEKPELIQTIPECGRDVYIAGRACLDFLYTPAGDPVVEVGSSNIVEAVGYCFIVCRCLICRVLIMRLFWDDSCHLTL
jgi:hypothetical protein